MGRTKVQVGLGKAQPGGVHLSCRAPVPKQSFPSTPLPRLPALVPTTLPCIPIFPDWEREDWNDDEGNVQG